MEATYSSASNWVGSHKMMVRGQEIMHVGTNLCDDFGSEFVDLSWESEPRQGNGEVNALFAVVDTSVCLLES
jgi:hypothetical protein